MFNSYEGLIKHINQRYDDAAPKPRRNTFNAAYDKATWENDPVITDDEEKRRLKLCENGESSDSCNVKKSTSRPNSKSPSSPA